MAIRVGAAVAVVAVVMVGALVAAVTADRDGGYPGYRSGPIASVAGAFPALPGSAVDPFEEPSADGLGTYPGLGPWDVKVKAWNVKDGVASATPYPGAPAVAVVQAKRTTYLFDVDVLDVRAGSGMLFRYQDAANYWSVQNLGGEKWMVLKVVGGKAVVVRGFTLPVARLRTLGVWAKGDEVQVAVASQAVVKISDPDLAGVRGIGLLSSSADTKFDNMSVYDG